MGREKLSNDFRCRHILAILLLPLHVLINTPLVVVIRIYEPHVPEPHLAPLPIVDLVDNRKLPKIIPGLHVLAQSRQGRDQDPPRQHPLGRPRVHHEAGRRIGQVEIIPGRHVPVVLAPDGPVAVLGQVVLGPEEGLLEGEVEVAVGDGRGLQAAVVEEEVRLRVGDAPQVCEPGLVGPGFGEALRERIGDGGGVKEAGNGVWG